MGHNSALVSPISLLVFSAGTAIFGSFTFPIQEACQIGKDEEGIELHSTAFSLLYLSQ